MTTIWAMLAIVLILLLGSLFWTSLGALVGAAGKATSSISLPRLTETGGLTSPTAIAPSVTPVPTQLIASQPLPTSTPLPVPIVVIDPSATPVPPTVAPSPTVATATTPAASPSPSATPSPATTSVPSADGGRSPWVLLPGPAADAVVKAGAVTLEARGRGDAPITRIQLELDGVPVAATTEDRGGSTWRGFVTVNVGAGKHSARAVVTDEQGRTGAYRWNFEAR